MGVRRSPRAWPNFKGFTPLDDTLEIIKGDGGAEPRLRLARNGDEPASVVASC
jgi:hypothetical protein